MYICRPSSTQLVVFDCVYAHQINSLVLNNTAISLHNIIVPYTCHSNQVRIIAEWRARASEARSVSALYSRFRDICIYIYIYIYMSVCTCIAQDRAHLMQVPSRRPIVHYPLEHWLLFGAQP